MISGSFHLFLVFVLWFHWAALRPAYFSHSHTMQNNNYVKAMCHGKEEGLGLVQSVATVDKRKMLTGLVGV